MATIDLWLRPTLFLAAGPRLFPKRPRGQTPLFDAHEVERLYSGFVLLPL